MARASERPTLLETQVDELLAEAIIAGLQALLDSQLAAWRRIRG